MKSTVESLESQLHQTTQDKEQMDQSLNDRITTLQSDLESLQAEKQSSEEDLQQQILLLKVWEITITKTCPCNMHFTDVKISIFSVENFLDFFFFNFCSKHRLWVHSRTVSARRF